MTREELQNLSKKRLRESKYLIDGGFYDGGYYLCGYSIECALKAVIAKSIPKNTFPDKTFAINVYTHDLTQLLRYSNLKAQFDQDIAANMNLKTNWNIVKDWSEIKRYEFSSRVQAEDLYRAVSHRQNGVLKWLKQYW